MQTKEISKIIGENKEIILGAMVLILAFYIYKGIKKKSIGESGGGTFIDKKTKPLDNSIKPTLTNTQATQVAETLFRYMNQFGTKEDELLKECRKYNGADLQKIFEAFGVRKYFVTGWSKVLGEQLNLFGWFSEELSGSDLEEMREIWEKANLGW